MPERNALGQLVPDENGNVKGGFRLPVADVPVAAYQPCGLLFGQAIPLDPVRLALHYPTHEVYLEAPGRG